MKRIIPALAFMLITMQAFSQRPEPCGTMPQLYEAQKNDPALKQQMESTENLMKNYSSSYRLSSDTGKIVTVPVVVHIIYNTEDLNIPDQRVYDAMTVLYQDFRKVPGTPGFNTTKELASDSKIEFALAKCDPQGNPTNGITRTHTDQTVFSPMENKMKFTSSGGHDIWDRDRYLNIWVCDMGSGTAGGVVGFAQFPGGNASTDGVVIQTHFFGAGQRTTTHEIGHWFNLIHIWGDAVCGDDKVDDTPVQQNQSFSCDPLQRQSVCGVFPTEDNYENYMDYSEGCTNMFTKGQVQRMHAALFTARPTLLTSQASMTCGVISGIDNEVLSTVSVYPNPADNYVDIQGKHNAMNVKIMDLTGKELKLERSNPDEHIVRINTSSLNNGIYFIHISSEKSESIRKLIIAK